MKDPDRLQALFDALAQPATPSELADEAQTVDVVARAISVSKGSTMQIPSNSRRLRVASFLAAGIIGFGGVAAAGPAVFDTVTGEDDSSGGDLVVTSTVPDVSLPETTVPTTEPEATTTTEPEATTTTEPEATTTTVAGATGDVTDDEPSELVDDPDTDFDETECADGNHGKTVSSVAQATPSGPGKGAIVSEAAQSSCGKKEKSDKDNEADGVETDDDSEDDDDSDEDDDSDDSDEDEKEKEKGKKEKGSARDDSPARDQSQGNGNGNGNGNGKGKGKNG